MNGSLYEEFKFFFFSLLLSYQETSLLKPFMTQFIVVGYEIPNFILTSRIVSEITRLLTKCQVPSHSTRLKGYICTGT